MKTRLLTMALLSVVSLGLARTAVGLEGESHCSVDHSAKKGGKRFYFFVPWQSHVMIGTGYKRYEGDPDKFSIVGKGWDAPADPNDPENQALNRRVEISVFPPEQK